MVIGLPLNSGYYWGILIAPFFTVTMNRLVIEQEEAYLEKKFGDVVHRLQVTCEALVINQHSARSYYHVHSKIRNPINGQR